MKNCILLSLFLSVTIFAHAQQCKTIQDLESVPGKYTNAANYKWPAYRAEYFNQLKTPAEKATAKQVLTQVENLELKSRSNFELKGGILTNTFGTDGYEYVNNSLVGNYRFTMAFHEYICVLNKMQVNGEFSTVLRVHVNALPLNTFKSNQLGLAYSWPWSVNDRLQYKDPKNFKPGTPTPKIALLNFYMVPEKNLLNTINSGSGYWQDVPDNKIRQGTRDFVYRFWFVKKNDVPVLVEVSRKEYLESLLEFYDREKELIAAEVINVQAQYDSYVKKVKNDQYKEMNLKNATDNYNRQMKRYPNWEAAIAAKKATVTKALQENTAEWLAKPAVVNKRITNGRDYPDQTESGRSGDYSETRYFTFKQFYDNAGGEILYKCNPVYFSNNTKDVAKPQLMTLIFRFVPQPTSQRLIKNFTDNFEKAGWEKLIQ